MNFISKLFGYKADKKESDNPNVLSIDLGENDLLVIQSERHLTESQRTYLVGQAKEIADGRIKVLMLDGGLSATVVHRK